jgi:hypothetical protein
VITDDIALSGDGAEPDYLPPPTSPRELRSNQARMGSINVEAIGDMGVASAPDNRLFVKLMGVGLCASPEWAR